VDHKGQHTHLGGTSLVQFNSTLVELGFLIVVTDPSDREAGAREVTGERSLSLLPSGKFEEPAEGKDLKGAGNRNSERRVPARSEVGELGSVRADITRKVDTGLVDQVSDNTKHTDASVLDLDVTEAVELLLVAIGNKAEGIEESKGSLGTELTLESHVGGNRGTRVLRGRGEGGGGGNEGGGNSELHDVDFYFDELDS